MVTYQGEREIVNSKIVADLERDRFQSISTIDTLHEKHIHEQTRVRDSLVTGDIIISKFIIKIKYQNTSSYVKNLHMAS